MKETTTAIERVRDYLALRDSRARASAGCGNHIHGLGTKDGETVLYADDLHALLGRIRVLQAEQDAAVLAEREACAKAAQGHYRETSMYDPSSPMFGLDMTPDRSDWGRGVQRGRQQAADAIRARSNTTPDG